MPETVNVNIDHKLIEGMIKSAVVGFFDFCSRTEQNFETGHMYLLGRMADLSPEDKFDLQEPLILQQMGFFSADEAARIVCGAWACGFLTMEHTTKAQISEAMDAFANKYNNMYGVDENQDIPQEDVDSVIAFIKSISTIHERI